MSLRKVWALITVICVVLAFTSYHLRVFRLEERAASNLREKYFAEVFYGKWEDSLPDPDEPPLSQNEQTPEWSLSQIARGRLYLPNNTCWLGYTFTPSPITLDTHCATELHRLPYIEDIYIDGEELKKTTELDFSRFSRLKRLNLSNLKISPKELHSIEKLRKLESLVLYNCELAGSNVPNLKDLTNLRRLFLDGTNIDIGDLTLLPEMKHMQELSLGGSTITDDGLAKFRHMPCLETLALSESMIRGVGFKHLSGSRINWLHLPLTKVDDEGMKVIAECFPSLKYLNLAATSITEESVPHLLKLESLEILSISQTVISAASIRKIREVLDCTVYGDE